MIAVPAGSLLGLEGTEELLIALVLVATCAAAAVADLRRGVIPNRVLLPAALAGLAIAAALEPSSLPERLAAGAGAGGFMLVFALIRPAELGMGDVKLVAVIGLLLGQAVIPALLIGLGAGSVYALFLLLRHGSEARKRTLPLGPFLALGALVALVGWA